MLHIGRETHIIIILFLCPQFRKGDCQPFTLQKLTTGYKPITSSLQAAGLVTPRKACSVTRAHTVSRSHTVLIAYADGVYVFSLYFQFLVLQAAYVHMCLVRVLCVCVRSLYVDTLLSCVCVDTRCVGVDV